MKTLKEKLYDLKNNILEKPLALTFKELHNLYKNYQGLPHKAELQSIEETFGFMIDYFARKTKDPEREKIYDDITLKTIFIIDSIIEHVKSTETDNILNVYNYYNSTRLSSILNNNIEETETKDIFISIWFTDRYTTREREIILNIFDDVNLRNKYGALIVSAISMSIWRIFEIEKLNLLIEIYKKSQGVVAVRSLVGIIFTIYLHTQIFEFYSPAKNKILELFDDAKTGDLAEFIILQHIKALETEDIIEEFQNEILPGMQEIQKTMSDLDILKIEEDMDDENPDWTNENKDKMKFLEKMEEFTMRQFEGADIYSPTLGKIKDFSFFDDISHWFLPFSAENTDAQQALSGLKNKTKEKFLKFLEETNFFCDSDKYSFCFHFSALPGMLQNTVAKMMIEQMTAMEEMNTEDDKDKSTAVSYIQDLYRFFNFSHFKGFENIFNPSIGIVSSYYFFPETEYHPLIEDAAELYLQQGFYGLAADAFYLLSSNSHSPELYEKAGFAYQKIKEYKMALEMYKNAEDEGEETLWLMKKLGFVNLKLKNYDEALKYYKKSEELAENDVSVIFQIGTCYVYKEDYENALQYFFKADYLKPDKIKTWRSIAYVSLKLKKFEQAEKYINKCVVSPKVDKVDYFILGTIMRLNGELNEAVEYFMTALDDYNGNYDKFLQDFNNYMEIMEDNGIPWIENELIVELIFKKYFAQ